MPPSISPSTGRTALASMCRSCQNAHRNRTTPIRNFSSSTTYNADDVFAKLSQSLQNDRPPTTTPSPTPLRRPNPLIERLRRKREEEQAAAAGTPIPFRPSTTAATTTTPTSGASANPPTGPFSQLTSLFKSATTESNTRTGTGIPPDEPYHIHVYAHKHNCHITFTDPSRNVIQSYSCGNIGLKKAQRQSFDASYQLATYAMKKMAMASWRLGGRKMTQSPVRTVRDVHGIEVVMRGFGPGREAFQKALLGSEGYLIRPLIKRVSDATRLKFGGARSPAPRRLG